MLAFLAAAALLVAAALAFLLPPLLARRDATPRVSATAANVQVVRDQLAELDADLARGTLGAERHAEARRELERRLLEDTAAGEGPTRGAGRARGLAIAVALIVPIVAAALYVVLGNPDALDREKRLGMTEAQAAERDKLREVTAKLAQRMQQKPDDAKGWEMLGRAYRAQDKLPQALAAYQRAVLLDTNNAPLLADFAELLAIQQGGRIDGLAMESAARALTLDPKNDKALALLGTAAFDARQYDRAIGYWKRLLALAPPGSDFAQAVQAGIREAEVAKAEEAAPDGAKRAAGGAIAGQVALAPAFAKQLSPDDIVFVLARSSSGPPMPLAVLRKQVRDLPFEFVLDDSLAMSPQLKLSGFDSVSVVARVSKSGNPIRAPGDFEGVRENVRPGASGVNLVIDQVVQ